MSGASGGSYRLLALAVIVGLVLGLATQIGQSVLPEGMSQVANSISPWVSVAFLVGSRAARPLMSAVAGLLTLAFALVGYYTTVFVRFGYTGSSTALTIWTLGAVIGGIVFGLAGWYWRHGDEKQHIAAVGLLAAVFVAEGAYFVLILPGRTVGLAFVVAGLVVPLVATRTARRRLLAYAAMVPALALGGLGYAALLAITMHA